MQPGNLTAALSASFDLYELFSSRRILHRSFETLKLSFRTPFRVRAYVAAVATKRNLILERLALLILGVYLAGGGITTLTTGRTTYTNYLHLPVAAASAVLVGAMLIVLGTLGWKWLASRF